MSAQTITPYVTLGAIIFGLGVLIFIVFMYYWLLCRNMRTYGRRNVK